MQTVGIGKVKMFDREKRRGVIAPQDVKAVPSPSGDLYFEVTGEEAVRLREGQLVQFVLVDTPTGWEAKDVTVLSQLA